MLFRTHTSTVLAFAAVASLIAGCVIVADDKNSTLSTSSSGGGDDTTTTTSSGDGGAGGHSATSSTTGAGGAGGDTTSGVGGGASCVGTDGTGKDAFSCDAMNITPAPKGAAASICEPNGGTAGSDPPPGYAVCQHGFKIFTAGSAEYLQACLGQISVSPADACSPDLVQKCIDALYNAACSTDETDKFCTQTGDACTAAGDTFKVDECAYQLKTFNVTALNSYVDCFNNAPADQNCQQAHDNCYADALTIAP